MFGPQDGYERLTGIRLFGVGMQLGLAAPSDLLLPTFPAPRFKVIEWLESAWPPGEAVCARVAVPTPRGVPNPSHEPLVGACLSRESLIGSAPLGVIPLRRVGAFVGTMGALLPLGRVSSDNWVSSSTVAVVSPALILRALCSWALVRPEAKPVGMREREREKEERRKKK